MIAAHLRRFARDKAGNVAIFTGLAAIPIAMAVGASVDLVDSYRQKERLQAATDAASLAGARTLMKGGTKAQAEAAARNYLSANLSSLSAGYSVSAINADPIAGTVSLTTKTVDRVRFGGLLGRHTVALEARSLAKGAGTTLEIALVLDTSGSMDIGTRIEDLRAAGAKFVDVMDADAYVRKKVSISVVPFSSSVNVGASNGSAEWIDQGSSPLHAEWLHQRGDPSAPAADRQTIRALMKSTWAWKGCVETRARGGELDLDVTDAPPATGNPQTLFTQMFAPDEPEGYHNNYLWDQFPDRTERLLSCSKVSGTSGSTTKWSCSYQTCVKAAGASATSCTNSSSNKVYSGLGSSDPKNSVIPYGNTQCANSIAAYDTVRARQDRTCKYKGGGFPTGIRSAAEGPNYMCDSVALLPLTKLDVGKSTIKTKITGLQAKGSTNILEGLMWGWRALSSGQPFTEGRPDGVGDNRKFLVVMTDGQNTMYDTHSSDSLNLTQYSTYGMGSTGRLKVPTQRFSWEHQEMMNALDDRMEIACENAKRAGYTIYTVILTSNDNPEPIDWTEPKALMRRCSSSDETEDRFFAPTQSSELTPVFEKIAKSIRKIHLAQ